MSSLDQRHSTFTVSASKRSASSRPPRWLSSKSLALRSRARAAFGIAMAVPLVVFGLAFPGTGLAVFLRTPPQVAALAAWGANPPRLAKRLVRDGVLVALTHERSLAQQLEAQ
ncbi:MAG: hypothetical protein JNJ54_01785 [Myxococcaceae bacterium]|nr:hypothetical protein [Myxococcaceae bacterium]